MLTRHHGRLPAETTRGPGRNMAMMPVIRTGLSGGCTHRGSCTTLVRPVRRRPAHIPSSTGKCWHGGKLGAQELICIVRISNLIFWPTPAGLGGRTQGRAEPQLCPIRSFIPFGAAPDQGPLDCVTLTVRYFVKWNSAACVPTA